MRRQIRAGSVTLPYLQIIQKGGRVYVYARPPGGPRKRLPDLDSPDFIAAYVRATSGPQRRARAATGTIAALIEAFRQSDRFLALSPGYRQTIARHLEAIRDQAEDALASHLKPSDIEADLDPLLPYVAHARLKTWRLLCGFGKAKGLISADPSRGIARKAAPKSDGHPTWTPEQIATFRARWPVGTAPRMAMELLYWTAARVGDAVAIGPGMVDRDGVLSFRQGKTGEPAHVPWTCPLPAYALHMLPERDMMHAALGPSRHMTFLATAAGRPRSKWGLSNLIARAAHDAGLVGLSAHGLRKARSVALAEGGATSHEGSSWTGHVTLAEWERYIRAANRRGAVIGGSSARTKSGGG